MTLPVYDGGQTAADILIGYNHYLRDEVVNLTNDEINELIKKIQTCADSAYGPKYHQSIDRFIEICREELEDRHLVCRLVVAGLIDGGQPVEEDAGE